MKHKTRQIDLPDEVRTLFPEALGTLKHIKVLTNAEYAELTQKQTYIDEGINRNPKEHKPSMWNCGYFEHDELNDKYPPTWICHKLNGQLNEKDDHCSNCPNHVFKSQIKHKRTNCSYLINNFDNYSTPYRCIIKAIDYPSLFICADCNEGIERSKFPITFFITPIDTQNIEIPTIHYKKEDKQKTPKVDDSGFT